VLTPLLEHLIAATQRESMRILFVASLQALPVSQTDMQPAGARRKATRQFCSGECLTEVFQQVVDWIRLAQVTDQ
jgi:hypothetical protein